MKKVLSFLFAVCFVMALVPTVVFAEETVATVKVGEKVVQYANFTDAWEAANSADGAVLTLLKDYTLSDEIDVTGNFSLNLNGKNLNGTWINVGSVTHDWDPVNNKPIQTSIPAYLTIDGTGNLNSQICARAGKFTVESGTINNRIYVYNTAEVLVNGGQLTSNSVCIDSYGTVTVNGGMLKAPRCVYVMGGTATITAGTFISDGSDGATLCDGINSTGNGTLNIYGGTFKRVGSNSIFGICKNVKVYGGEFPEGISIEKFNNPDEQSTLEDILAEGYGFYTVSDESTDPSYVELTDDRLSISGNVIVKHYIHAGGTATCKDKAVCDLCKNAYGELKPDNHANLIHIASKEATVAEEGNIEYWFCDGCGKYFSDKAGVKKIEKADTVTAKLAPKMISGDGAKLTQGEKKALSFTSNADFADFIRVELDGSTLDEKKYILKSGSTIVTLKEDFVSTLSVGEHALGIVSQSGIATAKFTVNEKPADDPSDTANQNPQTGDNSKLSLWIVLLPISGGAAISTTIVIGKKKYNSMI